MPTKTKLPVALVAVLFLQLVTPIRAQVTNSTSGSLASDPTSGALATHNGTDAVGDILQCVGPTPPPGLSFPIETVVEKLTSVDGPTTASYIFNDAHGHVSNIAFTATGATTLYTTFTRQQIPQYDPHQYPIQCCGQCTVYFSMVDVLYWPVPDANTACLNTGTNAGVKSALATVPASNNSISTTVGPDGFTYTSPSIYVAYHDISASNFCGQVGPKHTSITLSFQPGQLSTLEYSPGLFGFGGGGGTPQPFDLKNLPCPPQSLIDAQESANQPGLSLPARGTYAPIIAPPPYIQSLEPAWNSCISFYAFDPPKTLAPAVVLVPSPTPAGQDGPMVTSAMPSPTVDGPPVQTSATSSIVEVDPLRGPADPTGDIDPTIAADPKDSLKNSVSDNAPPAGTTQGTSPNPGASNGPSDPTANPSVGLQPANGPQSDPNGTSQSKTKNKLKSNPPVIAIGSQTLTALEGGGFAIADSTLRANDPAIMVQGIPVSLGSSVLVAGSSTLNLPSGDSNGVFTAAGHAFTPQPDSGVMVAGSTFSIKGPAATVSGTVVSLASSGLNIGSQTFAFPTSATIPVPDANSIFIIAGQIITPLGQSSLIVEEATLSINGPATTVSGTAISLASSGLVIASQTFALPTPAPGKLGDTIVIEGTTLTAGGPAVTIANTPVSLAAGTAGFYVAGLGSGSAAFSAPVTAGEIISTNTAGQLVVDGKTVSGLGAGTLGLGSAIMLGFGPASGASTATATTSGLAMPAGNTSTVTGVLGFTGEGRKGLELRLIEVVLAVLVIVAWDIWI